MSARKRPNRKALEPPPPDWLAIVDDHRTGLAILVLALAAGAALRAWLSFKDDGIYWPDEIFLSLEPAHRLVFGYGLIAWDFLEGARNWTLAGCVAGLLKLCAMAGFDDPRQYLTAIRLVFSAIGVATAYAGYVLARRSGASPVFAASGAAFFALAGPAIYFAPRALAETVSALPVVAGLALALPPGASRRDRIIGASLLGLATLLRLQNGLFCATLLGVFLARRRWDAVRDAAVVLAAWAAALGLMDRLTWGEWFQSARIYVRVNTLLAGAPITGTSPAGYYIDMFIASMPVATVIVAALCIIAIPRAPGLAFVTLAFFFAHVLVANKAYRYVLPALPLFGAMAALALDGLWRRKRHRAALAASGALLAAVAWSAAGFHRLTFADVGPYEKTRPLESAYDEKGPVNRLLIAASRLPDICGLRVETDHLTWIGGYTFLHRQVPLYPPDGPPRDSGRYNYVIAPAGQDIGTVVAVDRDRALVRLPIQSCTPDPAYDYRLPGWREIHKVLSSN